MVTVHRWLTGETTNTNQVSLMFRNRFIHRCKESRFFRIIKIFLHAFGYLEISLFPWHCWKKSWFLETYHPNEHLFDITICNNGDKHFREVFGCFNSSNKVMDIMLLELILLKLTCRHCFQYKFTYYIPMEKGKQPYLRSLQSTRVCKPSIWKRKTRCTANNYEPQAEFSHA